MSSNKKVKNINLKWKHVTVIFLVLIVFQVFISHLQRDTLREMLNQTMQWYKENSAQQIGNLTTTALEIVLETNSSGIDENASKRKTNFIDALNSILRQPLMNRNVEQMCVIIPRDDKFITFDLGQTIFEYYYNDEIPNPMVSEKYKKAVSEYAAIHNKMLEDELTTIINEEETVFHVFIPLVPYGEYQGAVYLRIRPDVSFLSRQVLSTFNKTTLIFFSLILTGLLAMYYVSTYIILERDEAREELYQEQEEHLQEQVAQEKERLFARRIYHTHHKAEKVMGFINEDVEKADENNVYEIKHRIAKYANFISRVIYDMKWFNPPVQTIRGNLFNTNLNEVVQFIVDNIFLRLSYPVENIKFDLNLDNNLPSVHVNEFVVWEIIEPLLQNAIEHSNKSNIIVLIKTEYEEEKKLSRLIIEDNGNGISDELLDMNEAGRMNIFVESISTKSDHKNKGYGCFLAYEISKRCGWELTAENKETSGARFILSITN